MIEEANRIYRVEQARICRDRQLEKVCKNLTRDSIRSILNRDLKKTLSKLDKFNEKILQQKADSLKLFHKIK